MSSSLSGLDSVPHGAAARNAAATVAAATSFAPLRVAAMQQEHDRPRQLAVPRGRT